MNKAHKVHATKIHQNGAAPKRTKPGRPYNGANLVEQRRSSAKKSARKAAAAGRKTVVGSREE